MMGGSEYDQAFWDAIFVAVLRGLNSYNSPPNITLEEVAELADAAMKVRASHRWKRQRPNKRRKRRVGG